MGGHRNAIWAGELDGERVAVRQSRRSPASFEWELDLIAMLPSFGVRVADPVRSSTGALHIDGLAVQRWVDGDEPVTPDDWMRVAGNLQHLHSLKLPISQRPDCCLVTELAMRKRSVDADLSVVPDEVRVVLVETFASFVDVPAVVIHGDPAASNLRLDADGQVTFLDWDESRIDLTWHDLSNLGIQVLDDEQHLRAQRLSNAWEALNAWTLEPDYARRRLALL